MKTPRKGDPFFSEVVSEQFVLEKFPTKSSSNLVFEPVSPPGKPSQREKRFLQLFRQNPPPEKFADSVSLKVGSKISKVFEVSGTVFTRGRFLGALLLSRKLFWEKFEVSPKLRLKNSKVGSFEKPPTSIRGSLAGARRTSGQGSPRVRTRWKSRQVF